MANLLKTYSALAEGKTADQFAKIEASQLRRQATADIAESVQTAKHERKKADLLQSRVTALAAASGASVSSVDIQNQLSDVDQQGEYNALAALYTGQTSAQSKRYAADVKIAEGNFARRQGNIKAATTIMDSAQQAMSGSYA